MRVQSEAPDIDVTSALRKVGAAQQEFVQFQSVRALPGSASSAFSFGTHAVRPSTGQPGDLYFETDRHWVYYYAGTAWKYLDGINYGTNATRAAITVTANDDGAVFYATDTKLWWQVSSGAWVQRDVAGLITIRKNTGADVGTRARVNLIEGSGVTLTVADDAGSGEVDVTIAAAAAGAPSTSQFVTLATDAGLANERVLTGTANQIVVTDNGAGSTVVLSTPQNIHTAATPTFASLTLTNGLVVDTTTLVADSTNNRVGVLTATPLAALDVRIASESTAALLVNLASDNKTYIRAGSTSADIILGDLTTRNVKIAGSAVRATTEGTNHLDIFNGTAPVGTLANGVSLYATAGELRVMDAGGTATLLSSHSQNTGEWIHDSYSSVQKKRLIVKIEQLCKFIDEKFGTNFVEEIYDELK